jgi:ubiquinone/menaquinone biosynthesis C-methylase UbiE
MRLLLLFTFTFGQLLAGQNTQHESTHQSHGHQGDSSAYIAMLENPNRDSYQKPEEVVAALELEEGEAIADIGAGSGYFAFRFSKAVGEQGKVFAVDVNPDMIRHMDQRSRELGTANLVTILGEGDDPLLPEGAIDRIFICNTWHHIGNQDNYLELMKQALKPGGQVIMVDYKKIELPVGPPVHTKIAKADLLNQMEQAGFGLLKEHEFLPYQYFLVFSVE